MFYKFVFIHKQNISLFSKQSKKCKQYNNSNNNNNNNNNSNKNKKTKCWNSMADKHIRHVFYLQFMITIFQVYFLISVKEVILHGL